MLGITTTRRYRRELAAAKAETDRLRRQLEEARTERTAFRTAATVASRRFSEADAAARRMADRNTELRRRISALTESDPQYAARLELRVARLLKAIERVGAIAVAERRRADHLQQRYDDAVGIPKAGIRDSARWQPGYVEPKADAS